MLLISIPPTTSLAPFQMSIFQSSIEILIWRGAGDNGTLSLARLSGCYETSLVPKASHEQTKTT